MSSEKSDLQPKEQFRVVINREANEAIEAFLEKFSKDGDASKVTKSDLANYIFTSIESLISDTQIAEIRALYFDPKKALEGILKGAGSGEDLPEDLREALLKHCGIKPATKEKRSKKLSTAHVDNS